LSATEINFLAILYGLIWLKARNVRQKKRDEMKKTNRPTSTTVRFANFAVGS